MGTIDPVTVPEGQRGPWKIERFTIEQDSPGTLYYALRGRPIYPGTYTRLLHEGRGVVMSDTPAERRDHIGFVVNAKGHVLINGLGLGMCLAAVLRRPEVTGATVVEIDSDLIALVGPHYQPDPRVQIVEANALEYQPTRGTRFGAGWHDIWDNMCADNLPEMHTLHRKYGRRADWQGSWGREEIEYRYA